MGGVLGGVWGGDNQGDTAPGRSARQALVEVARVACRWSWAGPSCYGEAVALGGVKWVQSAADGGRVDDLDAARCDHQDRRSYGVPAASVVSQYDASHYTMYRLRVEEDSDVAAAAAG